MNFWDEILAIDDNKKKKRLTQTENEKEKEDL